MILPLAIFGLTYLAVSGVRIPRLEIDRTAAALVGASAMVAIGGLPIGVALAAVNLETIALLLGMMLVTAVLVEAGVFRRLAWETAARAGSPRALLWGIVVVSGALSAVFVNDTICVMFTPLVVAVVEAAALPALPFLMALSTASNIGGVATFTGNPQNMIIGTHAEISYAYYVSRMAPVAVLGLAADGALLSLLFRRELSAARVTRPETAAPAVDRAAAGRALVVVAALVAALLAGLSMAGTAVAAGAALLAGSGRRPREVMARVDFGLLVFFAALFVVVRGVQHAGAIEAVNARVMPLLPSEPGAQLVWFSLGTAAASNVFSNVPWVLLALESVPRLSDPVRGHLALAMASTLAGNLTIFGSVANLIVLSLAGPRGRIGFVTWLRYGVVVTAVTLAIGIGVLLAELRLGI